jgi:hypothetical protein
MAMMAADPGGRPARSELSTTQSALRPADTGSIHTRTDGAAIVASEQPFSGGRARGPDVMAL